MSLESAENGLFYTDRSENGGNISAPAVITLEKSRRLRLPSIRSKIKPVETLSANDINADISLCGLKGSPTRVLKTFENDSDRRSCTFISPDKLMWAIDEGLKKGRQKIKPAESASKLKNVWLIPRQILLKPLGRI